MVRALTYYKRKLIETELDPKLTLADPDDDLNNDISLLDTAQSLVLTVTASQYQQLLSSAINGAYQTYPLDYNNVIYPLIKAGKTLLCDEIQACIENTPELQEQIAGIAINPVTAPTDQPFNGTIAGTNVVSDADTSVCNQDNFFGAMTGLVDLMNNLAEDIIEFLASSTNEAGRIGDVIEAIPVVGELPVDDILQLSESLMDDMEQNYQAYYTLALRDDYRCGLFCIGESTCDLTFQQIYDFFVSELGQSVPTTNVIDFITWFTTNPLTQEFLVHGWHVFLAGILNFGGSVIGIDDKQLVRMVSALYNDPDPDWSTLCSCVQTYYLEADLTTGTHGTYVTSGLYGNYVAATGWTEQDDGTVSRTYINYDLLQDTHVTNVEMRCSRTPSRPAGLTTIGVNRAGSYSDYEQVSGGSELVYPTLREWNGDRTDATRLVAQVNSSQGNTSQLIDRLRVTIQSDSGIPAQFTTDGWTEYTP